MIILFILLTVNAFNSVVRSCISDVRSCSSDLVTETGNDRFSFEVSSLHSGDSLSIETFTLLYRFVLL